MVKLFVLLAALAAGCQYSDSYKLSLACTRMVCMKGMVGVSNDVDGCGCAIEVSK